MPYRFGGFLLDYDARQVLDGVAEVHLSPKAFELLAFLLVNRHRAVSKAELQERLWPATFVEETNLAGLVAEIRRALDDSAVRPVLLRTVHRFGYRFVGEVVETSAAKPAPARGPQPSLVYENRHFALMEGVNVIGRSPDATIQCDVTGVSRHHARIVVANGEATLEDLDSKNGTYLQGRRVISERLTDGDEIRLAKAHLTFRVGPPPGATETVAPEPRHKPPQA